MYITSEYKEPFYKYIRNSDFQPSTIRNIQSDINALFLWLRAVGYTVSLHELVDKYRSYLINSHTPHNTMIRRISSVNKFASWILMSSDIDRKSESPINVVNETQQSETTYHQPFISYVKTPITVLSVSAFLVASLIMGTALVIQSRNTTSDNKIALSNTDSEDYKIQFDLHFSGSLSSLNKSKSMFQFKFYGDSPENISIGQVACSASNATPIEGSSKLRITLDSRCTPLQSELVSAISRNEAIYVDIFLNSKKLSNSKIIMKQLVLSKVDSNYQNSLEPYNNEVSKSSFGLPNELNSTDVLGLQTISSSSAAFNAIPLSAFLNVSALDDGDIVTLYNNQLIRALLSTNVLGVKSSDSIITKGVAYVHILNSTSIQIEPGDFITTSDVAGYGQKAISKYDTVVGIALESSRPGISYIKVLVAIQ